MIKHRCTSVLLGMLVVACLVSAVAPRAAAPHAETMPPHHGAFEPQSASAPPNGAANEPPNGISVGRPKVFDNRTLTLMLEALSETLRTLQVIDQKTVAAAFGLLQGSQSREFSSSLTVGTTPTAGIVDEATANTGVVSTAGNPLPDTTGRTTTTTTGSVTPQIPALGAAASTIAGFNPQFGENASDLLSDQLNLSYQIFNLRMILERSLSDRLVSTDTAGDKTRLQAVLGFNVTIDPPRTAEDSVAVVEITLTPQGPASVTATEQGLSLVALMPQEKTYNASALSTKSSSFGGAAVIKMIHVGYNQQRRGQTFYLYRDADTVAYERMGTGDSNDLKFGWMFRPVLGQNAVSPGLRQLFAVVSLPRQDVGKDDISQLITATVRTYWKKYDRDTLTSFAPEHVNRAAKLRYALSLSLAKPQIFGSGYVNNAKYSSIEIKPTARYQQGLTPTIKKVRWEIVGPKTAVVSVEGNNFFSGTQVVLGGKTYVGGGDGLILKSNQAFDVTTTMEALESGNGVVIGRYGAAVRLTPDPTTVAGVNITAPPRLIESRVGPALGGMREFFACFDSLPLSDDPTKTRVQPILSVNSSIVLPPYDIGSTCSGGRAIFANVPADAAKEGEGVFKLTWPFIPTLTAAHRVYNPASAFQVSQISNSAILFTNNSAIGFRMPPQVPVTNPCWSLLTGTTPMNLATPGCSNPATNTKPVSDYAVTVEFTGDLPDKFVLLAPTGGLVTLELPKKATTPEVKPIEVQQNDSVWIDVVVKDAAAVKTVDANQLKLLFRRVFDAKGIADPKKLQVQLTRELTSRAGTVELTFLDATDKAVGSVKVKVVCAQCDKEGEK